MRQVRAWDSAGLRSIDTLAGPVRYAGASVPGQVANEVLTKLQSFVTM